RTHLVGQLLPIILKSIAVHRIESDSETGSFLLDCLGILGNIPWNMKRYSVSPLGQLGQKTDIIKFFLRVSGFTADGKPSEAGPSRSQGPARHCDLKGRDLGNQR